MLSNKKATFTLTELAVLVLASVLITFVVFPLGDKAYAAVFGKKSDTVANYEKFVQTVRMLASNNDIFDADKSVPLFIDEDHIIVAYDKGSVHNDDICHLEGAKKPDACGEKACICLFKRQQGGILKAYRYTNDDFDKAEKTLIVQCDTIGGVDSIFTVYYNQEQVKGHIEEYSNEEYNQRNAIPSSVFKNILGGRYTIQDENYPEKTSANSPSGTWRFANLFIYGRCTDKSSDVPFGAQSLYVEKFTNPEDRKTYIFVAYPDMTVLQHSEDMRKKYGQRTAKEFSEMISTLLNDYKYEEALALYSQFRQSFPTANLSRELYEKFRVYIDEALAVRVLKDSKAAVSILGDYLRYFPNTPDTDRLIYTLASLYRENKDYESAKLALSRLLSMQSPLVDLARLDMDDLSILASVQNEGDLDSAIGKYESQKSSPDPAMKAQAHFKLGALYYASSLRGSSIPEYPGDKVVSELQTVVFNFDSSAYAADSALILGMFYEHKGDFNIACHFYNKVKYLPYVQSIFHDSTRRNAEERLDFMRATLNDLPGECSDLTQLSVAISTTGIDNYLMSIESPLIGIGDCIQSAKSRTRVPSLVILAVAMHESNRGTSGLAQKSKNLFGIKCTTNYIENYCKFADKTECCKVWDKTKLDLIYEPGATNAYRVYPDWCESINDFADLISTAGRYSESMEYLDDPKIMIEKIQEAGYATDPNWATAVSKVMVAAADNILQA